MMAATWNLKHETLKFIQHTEAFLIGTPLKINNEIFINWLVVGKCEYSKSFIEMHICIPNEHAWIFQYFFPSFTPILIGKRDIKTQLIGYCWGLPRFWSCIYWNQQIYAHHYASEMKLSFRHIESLCLGWSKNLTINLLRLIKNSLK